MGLFNDADEAKRRANLKAMEDRRLRFAERMQAEGFAPQKMVLASTERGGVIGLCRVDGQSCLVLGPDFGGEGEFVLERYDRLPVRFEEYFEESTGMGGFLGIGKTGAVGFLAVVDRGGVELSIPFIVNKNCALLCEDGKNPLLRARRRRGDANVVWEFPPVEKKMLAKFRAALREILEEAPQG